MIAKTEPAVCSGEPPKQTASNNQLLKTYLKATPASRMKLGIGELLLFEDSKQRNFWARFEKSLRQYITVKQIGRYV